MAYVALYRQWRPQDFEQLVGQEHISTTLKNAITANRIAHAYLFSGPRGTGKTSMAKILAKALNCSQGPTAKPCNSCNSCLRITDGSSMDVLEIDAASNRGIDEIRELREKVKFTPVDGRFKVYIIDEVHMLTTEAFNALLKTLEEPPKHAVFILATTEPYKIPATILSRCQRYDFRRISAEDIVQRLNEVVQKLNMTADPEAIEIIAHAAEGGLRDALSILDQCIAFGGDRVAVAEVRAMLGLAGEEWLSAMVEALQQRNITAALEQVQGLMAMGKDPRQVILELIVRFRNNLVDQSMAKGEGHAKVHEASVMSAEEYMETIKILSEAAQESKWAPHPRIILELAVVKICRRHKMSDITGLLTRIEKLEQLLEQSRVSQNVHPSPVVPPNRQQPVQPDRSSADVPALALTPQTEAPVLKASNQPPKVNPQHLGELWERVLADLLKNNKRAIHTCLAEGKLVSVTPESILIGFQLSFYKERVEKEDYRSFLEKLFAQITGQTRQIKCCISTEVAQIEQVSAEPAKEDPLVRDAMAIFGEQVVKIVNNN